VYVRGVCECVCAGKGCWEGMLGRMLGMDACGSFVRSQAIIY